jgi:GABA permease
VIALSQLRMRRELDAAGVQPAVRMWAFPVLTWLTIAFIAAVLVIMAIRPGLRLELWLSLALGAVTVGIGVKKHGVSKSGVSKHEAPVDGAGPE